MAHVAYNKENEVISVPGLLSGLSLKDLSPERIHVVMNAIEVAYRAGASHGARKVARDARAAAGNIQAGDL